MASREPSALPQMLVSPELAPHENMLTRWPVADPVRCEHAEHELRSRMRPAAHRREVSATYHHIIAGPYEAVRNEHADVRGQIL